MPTLTDVEVAERAARAAAQVALGALGEAVAAEPKDAPTDVVSEVDRAAEAAAVAVIAQERPDDGFLGEEGARREGERTWVIDALDGTLNYLKGLRGWCAAVALDGVASAVCDPVADELFSAAHGHGARLNGEPIQAAGGPTTLNETTIATFLHAPKRELPGVVDTITSLFAHAGSIRITGSGTLELAYVAAGRLDGWIQPATFTWDWIPGALLVTEAGGHAIRTDTDPYWCIAARGGLLEPLAALLKR
jgi:myo-inositol-1(or 4)-monophosphatase